jgi:ATP-dependent RNA helicase SUPV3L1/SUV3
VRIDMLERLGDLIRERVFWKPRFDGEPRPTGSVEGGGFTVVPDMMSLVGCSGEEFSAILRSLGFRMMRRPLPEPAPQPSEQEKPGEASSEVPLPAPSAIAESAAPNADRQQDEPAALEAALKPPRELEVWWPKDTGPFRRQHHHRRPKEKIRQKTAAAAPQHSEQQKPAKRSPGKSRPPAPAPNPDSPFAVLSSLRSQLADKKNA